MFVTNKQNKRIDKKDHNLYTYRNPTYRKEYEIDKYIHDCISQRITHYVLEIHTS